MDDDTVQTVALSDEQIDQIIDEGYVITDEWAFAISSGWDELNADGDDEPKPWTYVEKWESLRDGSREKIQWDQLNVRVVRDDEEDTSIDREELGDVLLEAFENADGETKQRLNDYIYEVGFRLEKTYEIIDERE